MEWTSHRRYTIGSLLRKLGFGLAVFAVLCFAVVRLLIRSVEMPGEALLATGVARSVAEYVEMRDGVRLALDVWLPENCQAGDRLPTAMRAARYRRAQDSGPLTWAQVAFTSAVPDDMMDRSVQAFN